VVSLFVLEKLVEFDLGKKLAEVLLNKVVSLHFKDRCHQVVRVLPQTLFLRQLLCCKVDLAYSVF